MYIHNIVTKSLLESTISKVKDSAFSNHLDIFKSIFTPYVYSRKLVLFYNTFYINLECSNF